MAADRHFLRREGRPTGLNRDPFIKLCQGCGDDHFQGHCPEVMDAELERVLGTLNPIEQAIMRRAFKAQRPQQPDRQVLNAIAIIENLNQWELTALKEEVVKAGICTTCWHRGCTTNHGEA